MIIIRPHTASVTAVCYSPDGSRLATVSEDGFVKVWDPATLHTERPIWEAEAESDEDGYVIYHGPTGLSHAQFTPDGKLLVISGILQQLQAWEAKTGRFRWKVRKPRGFGGVGVFVVSRDGKQLAFAGGQLGVAEKIFVLDPKSRKVVQTARGHADAVSALAAGPEGFASGGADRHVKFWPWDGGRCYRGLGLRGVVRGLAFSPDGAYLAASGGKVVMVWDMVPPARGKERRRPDWVRRFRGHTGQVQCLDFSPDGATLASVAHDGTVRIWDVATGGEVRAFDPRIGPLRAVAFAPDGLTLAFGSTRGHVGVLDVGG